MTGKQLKNSILQLAIQGKLVPQDPHDEPASELLKRIRKEKEQLVKTGKLKKKDLESTPIAEEDKPFEIPESWEWCRICDIVTEINTGKSIKCHEYPPLNDQIGIVKTGVTTYGYYKEDESKTCYSKDDWHEEYAIKEGDFLIVRANTEKLVGSCVIAEFVRKKLMLSDKVLRVNYVSYVSKKYILKVFQTIFLREQIEKSASGTSPTMKNISQGSILQYILPLPPLSEQHRIVEKIEELMPLVEEYDKAQSELDKLNESLPEKLKKSILQQAIMGKLVPQDPNDEPASELLKRIRKEKENLVKLGALKKKDLITTPISEEEKSFDIPESWEWVNIPQIGISQLGKTKNPNQRSGFSKPYLCSINVYWEGINLDVQKEMLFEDDEVVKYEIRKGDLLVCEGGDCGRAAIWDKDNSSLYQNALHRVRLFGNVCPKYLLYVLYFYKVSGFIDDYIKGETIKHLVKGQLDSIPFPLPPLSEQHRIVAKIEELFNILK